MKNLVAIMPSFAAGKGKNRRKASWMKLINIYYNPFKKDIDMVTKG